MLLQPSPGTRGGDAGSKIDKVYVPEDTPSLLKLAPTTHKDRYCIFLKLAPAAHKDRYFTFLELAPTTHKDRYCVFLKLAPTHTKTVISSV